MVDELNNSVDDPQGQVQGAAELPAGAQSALPGETVARPDAGAAPIQPVPEPATPAVQPSAEQTTEPLAEKPASEEPAAQPAATEPVAEKPASEEPAAPPLAKESVAEAVPPKSPAPAKPAAKPVVEEPEAEEASPGKKNWYILKVQSNREDSIRDALQRRVAIAGLERYFDEIIVPTEMVSEFKGGKKRVSKRKLYPGYLVVHMEINEDTWFLVRETPGIGDFTGSAGSPTPMLPHEVERILAKQEEKTTEAPKLKISFRTGDRVKINEGTFENFEGEVESIDEANGRVTVMINIFGRSTPVELEYWQIEAV